MRSGAPVPVGRSTTVAPPMTSQSATSAPVVLYPGSFDPIHLGHLDVIEQACELWGGGRGGAGTVVVAAMHNPSKPSGMFTLAERLDMIRDSVAPLVAAGNRVEVSSFAGLAVDAAHAVGASFMVKGLRTGGDFEVEQQMAHTNHAAAGVRTVYLPCKPALVFISSRFIREIAQYGGEVAAMVPPPVLSQLRRVNETPT
jgi:pantetheine-phosphate adenylyltransferase